MSPGLTTGDVEEAENSAGLLWVVCPGLRVWLVIEIPALAGAFGLSQPGGLLAVLHVYITKDSIGPAIMARDSYLGQHV